MTVTYKDIEQASAGIRTMDIKGKDYAIVNERVKAFRKVYPNGSITTEIVSMTDGMIVMRATACDGEGKVLATGTAYEMEASSYINKTSYIENCETSCIGRALGFCGFGIDTAICSAEEVDNAIRQQEASRKTKQTDSDPIGSKPVCACCNKPLTDESKDGKTYTIAQIATASQKKYGVYLHLGCAEKWEEELKNA